MHLLFHNVVFLFIHMDLKKKYFENDKVEKPLISIYHSRTPPADPQNNRVLAASVFA